MPSGETSKRVWAERVPQGFITITEAARICGRNVGITRKQGIHLGIVKLQGKGKPALIKTEDLELLQEALKEVRVRVIPKKSKVPEPKPKAPEAPKWAEPVLLAPSSEKEFEIAVRKVLHLMARLGIDSIVMQDGKAEMLRTVSVTKKEEIKG